MDNILYHFSGQLRQLPGIILKNALQGYSPQLKDKASPPGRQLFIFI